jgi:hypothetical protein
MKDKDRPDERNHYCEVVNSRKIGIDRLGGFVGDEAKARRSPSRRSVFIFVESKNIGRNLAVKTAVGNQEYPQASQKLS